MLIESKTNRLLVSLFKIQSCWMIEPLSVELNYSIPSVRRFLSRVGYYSSFTHNGKWYTLRSIPKFISDGLWFYGDIGFSNVGSLTKTLIKLISRSQAGMTAEILGEKLRSGRCHSVLVQLSRRGKLQREKIGRSYVYFAADPHTAAVQRRSLTLMNLPPIPLPAEIAVFILVEFIHTPDSSFQQLAKAIADKKSITVQPAQIERLFEEHGLKKTMRTVVPTHSRR
ncbi:MAG: hypothetical protein U9R20_04180 [Thermodesulfobacteriota bacterium]|nr:hypothetical protein [Thermodesulfobacteriota bacterium]